MPVTPTLLLKTYFDTYSENDFWNEDDNSGDPYLGSPYKWNATLLVTAQPHANHTTPIPYYYTGEDVRVGDWFATSPGGKAMMISEIVSQTQETVEVVLEDYERYNLFTDGNQAGYGLIDPGDGIIFRLDNDGMPILGPIQDNYVNKQLAMDLMARFIGRNGAKDFVLVRQENHGFFPGDVIYADFESDMGYKKVDRNNLQKAIGIVTESNVPGLFYFSYRPLGRLINNVNPPLWGAHGDTFYLDPNEPGSLTLDRPAVNPIPVYFQLDLPTRAIQLERGVEVVGKTAESETNKYDVESVVSGQTTFMMPSGAKEILYMAINGIENENFTFDPVSLVLVFDPVETGYGVDVDDEVFFIYKS